MLATVIVSIVLVGVVSAIIYFKVRNRKLGKGSCGCGCSECPSSGMCHPE